MKFQQIRSATAIVTFGGSRFLIDPWLAPKDACPPIPGSANPDLRCPVHELPRPLEQILRVDAVIATHLHFDHFDETAMQAIPKDMPIFAQDDIDAETLKAAFEDAMQEEDMDLAMNRGMAIAQAVGFGGSVYLFFLAPLVLLFSYTRKPKYPWMGMLVPVAGFALIFVAYVEGVHQILYLLPVGKVSLDELREMVAVGASMIQ